MKKIQKRICALLACLTVSVGAIGFSGCADVVDKVKDVIGNILPGGDIVDDSQSEEDSSSAGSSEEDVYEEYVWEEETEKAPSIGIEYMLSECGTYYIVKSMGYCTDTEIVIPAIYNNLPVKEIADNAFFDKNFITSITLSESLEQIGAQAFWGCTKLTKKNK